MDISEDQILRHTRQLLRAQAIPEGGTFAGGIPIHLLSCNLEERTMEFSADILPQMENCWGIAHGGMLATIFDTCMGCAAAGFHQLDQVRTVTLNTTYLHEVPSNVSLQIRVRLLSTGRTLETLELVAWLPGKENQPTNLATGTFYLRVHDRAART